MSLIHDALKEMEKPSGVNIPVSGAPSIPARRDEGAAGWLLGVLLGVVLALLALAAWFFIMHNGPRMASPEPVVSSTPQAQPAMDTAMPVTTPVVSALANTPAVEPSAAAAVVAPAPEQAPVAEAPLRQERASSVVFSDTSVDVAPPRPSRPAARLRKFVKPAEPVVAAPAEPAGPSSAQLFSEFSAALAANDLPRGKRLLDELSKSLPAHSLSLVRAQAWYAVKSGDQAAANRLYREILDRLPGDENASLNLASLEARAGHAAEAYALVNDVMQRDPDSVAGQKMMQALREASR